ncbi:MAG: MerR family transcriptional regulator [Ignavibacteriae bacterium]|nr:MerR family transcriptional regulator [Ignavibacteriota bacterium]
MSKPEPTTSFVPSTLYTIGEAADILGISIPTIRMYEREGLIIPYRKNSKHRRFGQSDIERIRCVRNLINHDKVSIAGIRRLLSLIPCWSIKNCPAEERAKCDAFVEHDKSCWMVSNKSWLCRSAECRECTVYIEIASCKTLKETIAKFTTREMVENPVVIESCEL